MPNILTNDQIISAAYVAIFKRAPDQEGLNNWRAEAARQQEAGKTEVDLAKAIASGFAGHEAFTTEYGALSDAAFIDAIYMNIGGKVADDAGKANWLARLTDSANPITRGELVGEFIYGVLSITPAELQALQTSGEITEAQLIDALARQDRLTNKANVGLEFANALGAASNIAPGTDVNSLASLAQDPAFQASQAIIAGVTEDDATMTAPTTYLAGTPTITGVNTTFGPQFSLTASAASVDEGASVTFSIANGAANTEYAIKLEGVQAADITGDLIRVVTTDANGKASVTVAIVADSTTEGAETLTATVVGKTTTASVTINDTSVNTPPVVTVDQTFTINEGSAADAAIGTVAATDAQADAITYAIASGNDAGYFAINAATGALTLTAAGAAAIDAESTTTAYTLGVVATDALGNASAATNVTVKVGDISDTAPVATAATAAATEAGAIVTGTLTATDADAIDAGKLVFAEGATDVPGLTVNADGTYSFDPSLNPAAQALTYKDAPLDLVANYTVTDTGGNVATSTLTITVTPKPLTFTLVPSAEFVEEGQSISYKLVASEAVQEAITGSIQVVPGDGTTGQTAANDFGSGALNPQNVTIAVGQTESTLFNLIPQNDAATEVPESYTAKATVVGYTIADVTGQVRDPSTVGGTGQTFMLTTGADTMPGLVGSANSTGTDGNDIINATADTFSALDDLNAGLGTDTLKIVDAAGKLNKAIPAGVKLTSIENVEINTTGDLGVAAGTGVTEKATVVFKDLAATQVLNIAGITVTASGGTATAADIATAIRTATTTGNATVSNAPLEDWTAAAGADSNTLEFTAVGGGRTNVNVSNLLATGTAVTGVAAGAATSQITTLTITDSGTDLVIGETVSFTYNGVQLTTAALTAATNADAALKVRDAINAYAGQNIAAVGAGADLNNDTLADTDDQVIVTANSPVSLAGFADTGAASAGYAYTLNRAYAAGGAAIPAAAPTITTVDGAPAAVAAAAYDLSSFTDTKSIKILGAEDAALKAASTQAVEVSGITGSVNVEGGASQTVNVADGNITLSKSVGAVSVTDTKLGTGTIAIDGGTTVSVNTTSTATNGAITIGTTAQATGVVSVTSNLNGDGTASIDQGDITVKGGSTVTVNSNLTIAAKNETAGKAHTFGDVAVTGDGKTTSVTVNQTYAETEFTKPAVAVVKELHTVTFKALAALETTTVDGLTFTASKALTAEEVAQAFSNLTAADTQTSGGKTVNGAFTGALSANFTSGAAAGAVVVFTAKNEDESLTLTAGAVDPAETVVDGTIAAAAVTSANTITYGKVTVTDDATAAIKTITVNGYGGASVINGSAVLETLTLKNGAAITVADTADTLTLNLEKIVDASALTFTAAPKTLNVNTIGGNHAHLVIADTETLNVSGTGTLKTENGMSVGALKTVKVTGTAGLELQANQAGTVTSVDTTGTTGTVTVSIEGARATYAGGAGKDVVTLATDTALTQAINLGAGDDTLSFAALAVSGSTAALNGGDGTDTLSMAVATAAALDAAPVTFYAGFERLTLNNAGVGAEVIDLANLGFTNYVTTTGSAGTLTLNNLANNGTVVLTAAPTTGTTVQIKDAATGTADVLNVTAQVSTADINFKVVTAANVETINLTSTDTDITAAVNKATLVLTADKATTVNLGTSNAATALTLTSSNLVTLVDGSTSTGALTFTAALANLVVKGSSAADMLTANADDVSLYGNAGADTLTVAGGLRVNLYGGDGADTFVFNTGASATLDAYAVINGVTSGDVITLVGADSFGSTKIALSAGADETLLNYANQAIKVVGEDDMGWFQKGGNTYIVMDTDNTDGDAFVAGTDMIVMITGLVDLGTGASYHVTNNTLEIA